MTIKTAIIVAALVEADRIVHTVPLEGGIAPEVLTYRHDTPDELKDLDFDFNFGKEFPSGSIWHRNAWGSADYIPLEEWMAMYGKEPEPQNLVPRPGGAPLVIVRYVEYVFHKGL